MHELAFVMAGFLVGMVVGLTGVGGAGDWALDVERTVRLTEPKPEAKPDLKQDVKPEPKPDAKPEAK